MRVKVKFSGSLSQLTACTEAEVELPEGSSVLELVQELTNRFGPGILGTSNEHQVRLSADYVGVSLNNVLVFPEEYPERILKAEDALALIPLAAGG